MLALFSFCLSLALSLVLLPYLHTLIASDRLRQRNYRGWEVSSGGGLLFVFSMLFSTGTLFLMQSLIGTATRNSLFYRQMSGLIVIVLGAGLFGSLDDLLGDRSVGGFKGHLGMLLKGRLTTGMVKALGGVVLSFLVVVPFSDGLSMAVLNALVIALFVNFFNLLDLRPGRTIKVSLILGMAMFGAQIYRYRFDPGLFIQDESFLIPWGLFLGPTFVLLHQELKESLMLGDAGSNIVGGFIGYVFVLTFQDVLLKLSVLVLLLGLNLLSEKFSFSRLIETTPVLRQLDELGRRKGSEQ